MRGFSLVELSIVLVILGLLTGGILAGQNLIRAAEIRSISTQFDGYVSAVHTFRDKYFALPGDFTKAEDFWGTMSSGTCPNATGGTGTQTCNGDGDGSIEGGGAAGQSQEYFTFWQHLANASLIEGTYTGLAGPGNNFVAGENIPRAKINQAGWGSTDRGNAGDGNFFAIGDYGNTLQFGKDSPLGTNYVEALRPEEAWNVDTKVDDGLPARGKVIAVRWNSCTTATLNTQLDAEYELTSSAIGCALNFVRLW